MCGISGFVGLGDDTVLARMGATLTHRGPDDRGFFHVPGEVGLDFRRLSIIDLATGNQPLANEDGSVVSLFNGEIYNYRELRDGLKTRHQFKTSGDAEVIPHLYEEYGTALFERLNGMFAVAIWDRAKRRLILARDRFGKKPLYYMISGDTLVFASEAKAILAHPLARREIDPRALYLYLTHEYVPSPYSLFKGIRKIMPGSFAVFENGSFRETEFYAPRFFTEGLPSDEGELLRIFDGLMRQAVTDRLVSDVPLGAFLSGGLDSSAICAYAAAGLSAPLKTFSVGFPDPSFDESGYARLVAKHLSTDHHERVVEAKDILAAVPELTAKLDEPTGDAAIFPNHLLSRFARESVTVVLGGDGGDELFMGYPTFQAHRLARWYERIPGTLRRRVIEPLIRVMPASYGHLSLDYRLKRFILGLDFAPDRRDLIWIGSFTPEEKRGLLTPEFMERVGDAADFEIVDRHARETASEPLFHRIAYQYQRTYMTDDVLCLKDRASMLSSLELRAPLLDYRLADFINSLPVELKLKGFTTKYLFKKLMEAKLPKSIVHRKKKGFGVPIGRWLKGDLKPMLLDTLNEEKIHRDGIFRYENIRELLDEHVSGRKDNRKPLWTLFMFQLWKDNWIGT